MARARDPATFGSNVKRPEGFAPEGPDPEGAPVVSLLPILSHRKQHHVAYVPLDEHRHFVMILAANGTSQTAIAEALGISVPTLVKNFADELSQGFERVKSHVGAAVVTAALNGNISAAKYWLSVHCKEWRIKDEDLLADAPENDGGPVRFYMPANGRDKPEPVIDPTITIDGESEEL